MPDGGQILARTALTLGDSQGRRLEFIVHLFLRQFLGGQITDTLNRDRIILDCQFERPGAIFVLGVLHVAGDSPIGNIHGVDVINIDCSVPQRE